MCDGCTEQASPVAVHFALPEGTPKPLSGDDIVFMDGSLTLVKSDKDLCIVIAAAMRFPGYFGNNWGAVDKCLTDVGWLPAAGYVLVLRGAEKAWLQTPRMMGRLVTSWLDAAEYWMGRKVPFHLVFVMAE